MLGIGTRRLQPRLARIHSDSAMKTAAAAPMMPVAIQPVMVQGREMRNFPMIEDRTLINMMSAITGAATMPLRTAAQTRALMGLREKMFSSAPNKVAHAIAA